MNNLKSGDLVIIEEDPRFLDSEYNGFYGIVLEDPTNQSENLVKIRMNNGLTSHLWRRAVKKRA
jgi:hypothetical protein